MVINNFKSKVLLSYEKEEFCLTKSKKKKKANLDIQ